MNSSQWFVLLLAATSIILVASGSLIPKQVEIPDEPLDPEVEVEEPWEEVERELDNVEEASKPQLQRQGQCPCVKLPGSSECFVFSYDKELMADSLEEALVHFRNPRIKEDPRASIEESGVLDQDVKDQLLETDPSLSTESPPVTTRFGHSVETKEKRKGCCQKIISSLTTFAKTMKNQALRNSTLSRAKTLRQQCKINPRDRDYRKECKKNGRKKNFRKTANYEDLVPELSEIGDDVEVTVEAEEITQAIKRGVRGKNQPKWCERRNLKGKRCRKELLKKDRKERKQRKRRKETKGKGKNGDGKGGNKGKFNRRNKRDTSGSGESWPADCRYRRGADMSEDETFVGLCNLCWSWRILDDQYYPNFLNELSCDSEDNGCLAGWGECRPRWRAIEVMSKSGSGDRVQWNPISMTVQVACECRIKTGSPLHNFVAQ